MRPIRFLFLFLWLVSLSLRLQAEEAIHHGPVLDIQVQRGNDSLSIFNVPRLRKGDRIRVMPDLSSLSKGDWVLLLARISPSGNQVDTFGFDLDGLQAPVSLEITSDEQVPVIMLAPQLRNLFGLYTSFSESADLLKQALASDPQRFYDLQKLDQINQAITALSQGLDQLVQNRSGAQGIAAAQSLAVKFGVRSIDAECFKNNAVNTQCVAANIVANKDFVLPSSSELGMVMGQKKAADLTSFLTANIRVFSEAGDFLTHKFRDQYDFAPTFGRRKDDTWKTALYSLARFKNGSIKTAYVYVPAWFSGAAPSLSVDDSPPACLPSGKLDVQVAGRLPIMNYWHDWEMKLVHPLTRETLALMDNVAFRPERGVFQFGEVVPLTTPEVTAYLRGKFGFDAIELPAFRMALPLSGDVSQQVLGTERLISGDRAELRWDHAQTASCIERMRLERNGVTLGESVSEQPLLLQADLSRVSPGEATLWIFLKGSEPQSLALNVQPSRAHVTRLEHAELDEHLTASGEQLERIARVQIGDFFCVPQPVQDELPAHALLRLTCPPEVRLNARLPDEAIVHHKTSQPPPFSVRLRKTVATPRFQVAPAAHALLVRPSVKALQWGLTPHEVFFSEDSGLSLLLQATEGYSLARGSYVLQLRFVDDPGTAKAPITTPLMADMAHQELRTRAPLNFKGVSLPSVVNPLEFRVRHESSDLNSAWMPLNRAVLMLPELRQLSCAPQAGKLWLHGRQLDLIDAAAWADDDSSSSAPTAGLATTALESCPDGLCLLLPAPSEKRKLTVALHWVSQRNFAVDLGDWPQCVRP